MSAADRPPEPPLPTPPAPPSDTEFLLTYLKSHDAFCPLCKYNLRHLTVPRCPECGREIKITVGLSEPYLRAYIVLLVALVLPAGLGVLAWIQMLKEGWRAYSYEPSIMVATVIGFQASVIPAFAPLLLRRRFLVLPARTQRILAGVALAEPIILFGLWIISVFLLL